jgi:hypothetical protein
MLLKSYNLLKIYDAAYLEYDILIIIKDKLLCEKLNYELL